MPEKKLAAWHKILPNQPFNSDQFAGDTESLHRAMYESILKSCGLRAPADEFKLERTDMFTIEEMASSPVTLAVLQMLIAANHCRRVLEIGAFIGVSALYMAKALPPDGEVVTLEKFDHFAEIARHNFRANGMDGKIKLMLGDAHDVMPGLPRDKLFDLVFIDGNKERYADYFHMVEPLVARGGLVVVDDAFFHGDALNAAPKTAKGKGVKEMLDVAASSGRYRRALLPISNGMLVMRRED